MVVTRVVIAILLLMLPALQYRLWVGDGSLAELHNLRDAVDEQKQENEQLSERNLSLEAEVEGLKTGLDAVEERARRELGMIRDGEVYYQYVEPPE